MCGALDVADYILQEKGRLTAFQLQKLLYYCKAWSLVWGNAPVFGEPIAAWGDGPVVYDVYKRHAHQYSIIADDIHGDRDKVPADYMPLLDGVLSSYGRMGGDDLRDLTHAEEPWKDAYNGNNGLKAATISDESMHDYYSRLMNSDETTRRNHHVPHFTVRPVVDINEKDFEWLTSQL